MATCAMSTHGYIHVHNKELCAEVLECAVDQSSNNKLTNAKGDDDQSTSLRCDINSLRQKLVPFTDRVPSTTSHVTKVDEWLASKARRAIVALPDSPEMKDLKATCNALQKREHELILELNNFLECEETQQQCKKEMLYKKWSERVFTPIHSTVCEKMHGDSYHTNDFKKRQLFEDYLTYSNQQMVFLDTIGDDYKPLVHLSTSLKVKTKRLNDPLLSQQLEADTEEEILRACNDGYPPPKRSMYLGRKDTNPVLWLAMELVQIDSKERSKRCNAMKKIRNTSSQWNTPEESKSEDVLKDELKLPHKKRITYERQPLKLDWARASTTNEDHSIL